MCAGPLCAAADVCVFCGALLGSAAGAGGGKAAGGCSWSERSVPATTARPLHDDGGSCGFLCLHAGWLRPQGSPDGSLKGASVQVFALCVAAVPLVKSDAEGAAAVLFDQVGGLNLRCCAGAGLFAFLPGCVPCLVFPPPLPSLPLPSLRGGGFWGGGGGLARYCSKLPMSARTVVISCRASSSDQPVLCSAAISCQSLRSAATSSVVVTVQSDASAGECVARSRTFLSKAFSRARCAPLHSAIALRKTVCILPSHAGLRRR